MCKLFEGLDLRVWNVEQLQYTALSLHRSAFVLDLVLLTTAATHVALWLVDQMISSNFLPFHI